MKITVKDILKVTAGNLLNGDAQRESNGVSIDTRTLNEGELFVAIKGVYFDGHDFVGEAVKKGASTIVVTPRFRQSSLYKEINLIQVEDTVKALGDLASWWRNKFKVPCVAITGSNGKSTTKEMAAAIASVRGPLLKTQGNFNNLIGLPLTVFKWEKNHQTAILEMGMNAAGEIKRLTEISRPDVGLITNVTAAHLEKLQTVEGVAQAKGELFETMAGRGVAIVNDEDPLVKKLGSKYSGRIITFGMQNTSDIQFRNMESVNLSSINLTISVLGKERLIRLPLPGTHNVMNAMAAIGIGVALDIDLDEMLKKLVEFRTMAMRFERIQLTNGVCLINDSYNANPQSMMAAFRTVGAAKRAGRFIAVLGDMLELGKQSADFHRDIGKSAVDSGAQHLFLFGNFAREMANGANNANIKKSNVHVYDDIEQLESTLAKEIKSGDIVLVKGSRGMKMERIVEYLKNEIGCG